MVLRMICSFVHFSNFTQTEGEKKTLVSRIHSSICRYIDYPLLASSSYAPCTKPRKFRLKEIYAVEPPLMNIYNAINADMFLPQTLSSLITVDSPNPLISTPSTIQNFSHGRLASSSEGVDGVAVALADGVPVASAVLSVVGSIVWCPGLVVKSAVGTLWYGVLGQDIGVEEAAGLVGAVLVRVAGVVAGLRSASCGADGWIVTLRGREWVVLGSHEGILLVAVQWSVDGSTKLSWASVARLRCGWSVLVIA
jgi:hypothetical protein